MLDVILSTDFFFTAIRVMTPILVCGSGCMVFTKGGIDSIGTEGIMLMCALVGPLTLDRVLGLSLLCLSERH